MLLLLGLALLIAAARLPLPLQSQREAERWAGGSGKRYRQLTAILTPGQTLEQGDVYSFRTTAMDKITASDFEIPEGGSALCDAWSVTGTLKVSGPRGSFDAAGIAVGGSFFDFHPMPVRSGSLLSDADVMHDRVVLDEQLAWMLYGSSDLAGQTVQIGQGDYFVAGVVAQPDDHFTRAVSDRTPTVYLSYESRSVLSGSGTASYEVVLPDPVKGFAKAIVESAFASKGVVVENTDRFSFASSLGRLRNLGTLGTRTTAVIFPSWENAAVAAETTCALLRGAAIVCLIWPAVLLIAALRLLARAGIRRLKSGGRAAREALLDRRDERRMRIISRGGSHSK